MTIQPTHIDYSESLDALERVLVASLGCKCDVAEFIEPGTARVGFATADEAESAIAALNSSILDGESITVEAWRADWKMPQAMDAWRAKQKPKQKVPAVPAAIP